MLAYAISFMLGVASTVVSEPVVNYLFPRSQQIAVPQLVGMFVNDAEPTAISYGLALDVKWIFDPNIPENLVMAQQPSSGMTVRGATMTATASLGPPPSPLPSVKIANVRSGDKVEWISTVRGNSTGVVLDRRLNIYVLIFPMKERVWWVQGRVVLALNGEWTSQVLFGRNPQRFPEDIGETFKVVGIVTPWTLLIGQRLLELPYFIALCQVEEVFRL